MSFVRRGALDGLPAGGALNSFFAFDASFRGGARVAYGDVTGDGVPDVIAGAGPGASPEVRIYDGASGALVADYLAFEATFRGGVFVAAADVDGDGAADVIVGSGAGGSGEVKVFHDGGAVAWSDRFVFDRSFTGGSAAARGSRRR